MSNRKNKFNLNDHCEIEISDGFIRFNSHGGSCDLHYKELFTLNHISNVIQSITQNKSGDWFIICEGIFIAVEFDLSEDYCVLEIIPPMVYMSFGMKASLLPNLAQFFIDND